MSLIRRVEIIERVRSETRGDLAAFRERLRELDGSVLITMRRYLRVEMDLCCATGKMGLAPEVEALDAELERRKA